LHGEYFRYKSLTFIIFDFAKQFDIFTKHLILEKMGNFGATEIILIILVIVLLFGGRKIPELMKGIGQGMKEFKKASKVEDEPSKIKSESKEDTRE